MKPTLKEIQELVDEYNHKLEHKKGIIEELEIFGCTSSDRELMNKINIKIKELKQKAQKYKEILSKGCGKEFLQYGGEWICGKDRFLCQECQEKLKLLQEVLE